MTHTALVALANGFEEIEAACIVDVLRRADVAVTIASVGSIDVTGAHGMVWRSDGLIGDCIETIYDLVVLPGGMPGATNLQHSTDLTTILKEQASSGRLYAAICASPSVVLAHHGLLSGKRATCYPGFENQLPDQTKVKDRVVVDGNCVTSQGPGTAMEFALTLVKVLEGEAKSRQLSSDLLSVPA